MPSYFLYHFYWSFISLYILTKDLAVPGSWLDGNVVYDLFFGRSVQWLSRMVGYTALGIAPAQRSIRQVIMTLFIFSITCIQNFVCLFVVDILMRISQSRLSLMIMILFIKNVFVMKSIQVLDKLNIIYLVQNSCFTLFNLNACGFSCLHVQHTLNHITVWTLKWRLSSVESFLNCILDQKFSFFFQILDIIFTLTIIM